MRRAQCGGAELRRGGWQMYRRESSLAVFARVFVTTNLHRVRPTACPTRLVEAATPAPLHGFVSSPGMLASADRPIGHDRIRILTHRRGRAARPRSVKLLTGPGQLTCRVLASIIAAGCWRGSRRWGRIVLQRSVQALVSLSSSITSSVRSVFRWSAWVLQILIKQLPNIEPRHPLRAREPPFGEDCSPGIGPRDESCEPWPSGRGCQPHTGYPVCH